MNTRIAGHALALLVALLPGMPITPAQQAGSVAALKQEQLDQLLANSHGAKVVESAAAADRVFAVEAVTGVAWAIAAVPFTASSKAGMRRGLSASAGARWR